MVPLLAENAERDDRIIWSIEPATVPAQIYHVVLGQEGLRVSDVVSGDSFVGTPTVTVDDNGRIVAVGEEIDFRPRASLYALHHPFRGDDPFEIRTHYASVLLENALQQLERQKQPEATRTTTQLIGRRVKAVVGRIWSAVRWAVGALPRRRGTAATVQVLSGPETPGADAMALDVLEQAARRAGIDRVQRWVGPELSDEEVLSSFNRRDVVE